MNSPAFINFEREKIDIGIPWRVWHVDRVYYVSELELYLCQTILIMVNRKGLLKVEEPERNIKDFSEVLKSPHALCDFENFCWEKFDHENLLR